MADFKLGGVPPVGATLISSGSTFYSDEEDGVGNPRLYACATYVLKGRNCTVRNIPSLDKRWDALQEEFSDCI